MYKEHPDLNPPPDDAVLWRYMDFTKFVSLLDRRELFFARADKLGDPFEGSFSRVNEALRPTLYAGRLSPQVLQGFADHMRELRRFTLISCWHQSLHESAAMWRLYASETDGIAIKTDFGSFKQSLKSSEDIYIGKINYVDYKEYFIPENNLFAPFLHKRQDFKHEQEVRAIILKILTSGKRADFSQDICDIGKYYEVDLSLLIQEVIVAPLAQDWFLQLVESITDRYNLGAPVIKSERAVPPTWG